MTESSPEKIPIGDHVADDATNKAILTDRVDCLEKEVAQLASDLKSKASDGQHMETLLTRLEDLETALKEQHTAIADALTAMQQTLETVLVSDRRPNSAVTVPAAAAAAAAAANPSPSPSPRASAKTVTFKEDANEQQPNTAETEQRLSTDVKPSSGKPPRPVIATPVLDSINPLKPARGSLDNPQRGGGILKGRGGHQPSRLGPHHTAGNHKDSSNPMSPRLKPPPAQKSGAMDQAMQAARRDLAKAAAAKKAQIAEESQYGTCEFLCWVIVGVMAVAALVLGIVAQTVSFASSAAGPVDLLNSEL